MVGTRATNRSELLRRKLFFYKGKMSQEKVANQALLKIYDAEERKKMQMCTVVVFRTEEATRRDGNNGAIPQGNT